MLGIGLLLLAALGCGVLVVARRRGRRSSAAVEGQREIDEVCVCVDVVHSAHQVTTRVRACYVMLGGPRFHVRRDGAGAMTPFYVSEGDDAAWTPLARDLSKWLPDGATVTCDGRTIVCTSPELLDAGKVEVVVDLVAELAQHGMAMLDVARALPGANYAPPVGPWNARSAPVVEVAMPAVVRVLPEVHEDVLMTAVRGACSRATAVFTTRFTAGTTAAEAPIPAGHVGVIAALGECVLESDGEQVCLRWPGLELDGARLAAAARLVAAYAGSPSLGVFR